MMNPIELIAVFSAILYLVLAVRQNILCWSAWIISSCLYFFIMFQANLYMESLLQIFYIVMGIYGWMQWNKGGSEGCLLYTSPSPRDGLLSRMPSSA